MGEPGEYDVIIDRISHEVGFYRAYLKHASLLGTKVVNNPFMWSADDKFFDASLATVLGVASPKTVVLPNKDYIPGISHSESLRNLKFPMDWKGAIEYVGLPCVLKDAHGGGWRDVYICHSLEEVIQHYNDSGLLTMVLQEFIEWDQYIRCLCLGQEEVLPMQYDPKRATLHRGRELSGAGAQEANHRRRADARARARLRHEQCGVRCARRRSVRHRLHESRARHGHQLADAAVLRLDSEAHGRHGHQMAQEPRTRRSRRSSRRCPGEVRDRALPRACSHPR